MSNQKVSNGFSCSFYHNNNFDYSNFHNNFPNSTGEAFNESKNG